MIPGWFHFHFLLYERIVKTVDVSFSTNILVTRDSSFTMYTYKQYLSANLKMLIYHSTEYLISPNLQFPGSNPSVWNLAILPYSTCQIERIFVHIACHLLETFATYYSVFAKWALVSVLGNFLVNSKCLYLLWKFLINQKWWNELV